ncbi:MAG: hypothetical protein D6731_04685 [Planctomycetota bacterium]|nr:MAG: hypothetical protein D6731_04685 [Planctomycetota bacterium]
MGEIEALLHLTAVLVVAVAAQWIAWRTRMPSILLLLVCGLCAGPGAEALLGENLIQPDRVFGDLLRPLTSVSVGLILYEGGLSLRLREIAEAKAVVRNLVTVGALFTWLAAAGCAYALGLLAFDLALLLGAVLVVTGPTVIAPILRQVRPRGMAGAVLKWESIVIDPIGAVLAVLVFEALLAATIQVGIAHGVLGLLKAAAGGGLLGLGGAYTLILMVRKHWVPEYLENPVSLALLATVFAASNVLQEESGLVAATVMGFVVGHVLEEEARPIAQFKENLQVLLIGVLFVLLSARLRLTDLEALLDWRALAFVVLLVVVVRPLAVLLSTLRASVSWSERLFLAWLAPRGIVAAAVASVFGLRLSDAGYANAEALAPLTFLVIIATVSLYGLSAAAVARRLGLAVPNPQGVLVLGAQEWVRDFACALRDAGADVRLIDNNFQNVRKARAQGLSAIYANVRSRFVAEDLDLSKVGQFLALTSNDEVNTLAAEGFAEELGRARVYQLHPSGGGDRRHDPIPSARARRVFGASCGHDEVVHRLESGFRIHAAPLDSSFGRDAWREAHGEQAVALAWVGEGGAVVPFAADGGPAQPAGGILVGLVPLRDSGGPLSSAGEAETKGALSSGGGEAIAPGGLAEPDRGLPAPAADDAAGA